MRVPAYFLSHSFFELYSPLPMFLVDMFRCVAFRVVQSVEPVLYTHLAFGIGAAAYLIKTRSLYPIRVWVNSTRC